MDKYSLNNTRTDTNDQSIRNQGNDPDRGRTSAPNKSNYGLRSHSTGSWSSTLTTGFPELTSAWPQFSNIGGRRKTISESSDASTSSTGGLPDQIISPLKRENEHPDTKCPNSSIQIPQKSNYLAGNIQMTEQNLSFGNSSQVVYDIDGKFPYSYYESKPTLYDIDGIHRYKHYRAYKPTPYTDCAPHHEKRPWIYDPAEGMVMCLTAKDLRGQQWQSQEANKNKT